MNKIDVKLIALDLDDTLLNDNREITEGTVAALRGEWLEQQGYKVQMLEFIDMEHTPKNILIRAVKKNGSTSNSTATPKLMETLGIKPEIYQ